MKAYEEIRDTVFTFDLTGGERDYVISMLKNPTEDFKQLSVILDDEGCKFPLTQAGLMLLNTPGAAAKVLLDANRN